MRILKYLNIIIFSLTVLFSFNLYSEEKTIRIVSKDLSADNELHQQYMSIGVEALKKQGIDIKLEIVELTGGQSYKEKLPLAIMSGDIPDIIYDQYGYDKVMSDQGILEDLTPYVANSEILQNAMWKHNKERLKNYPYLIRAHPPRIRIGTVRADWLEMAGMDEPQNLDDYYKMLKAFSESDFDGNGANDSFGLTMTGSTKRCDWIFEPAFGLGATWDKNSDGYSHRYINPKQKDKFAFYNKLYVEGILDPEFITDKWDVMEDKYYSGKAGMICGSIGLTMNVYQGKMDNVQGKHTPILALKPPANAFAPIDASKEGRGYMISALSDVKEEAFAFLEYWASAEGLITEKLGLPGVHHNVNDGKYELTEKHPTHEPLFWEPNIPAPVDIFVPAATQSFNYAAELVTYDNKFAFPEELQAQADSAENTYWEYSYKFITGEIPLSDFDAYVDTWLSSGGKDITEYANTVLK